MDSSNPAYVFGLRLNRTGGAEELDAGNGDQIWIHIDYSTGSADKTLAELGIDEIVIESLLRYDTRPRCSMLSDGIIIVLRAINLNPGADPEDMVSLRLWLEPDRLVSVRQRKVLSVQATRESLEKGSGPENLSQVVIAIIERIADRIAEHVEQIGDHLENLEVNGLQEGLRSELLDIRRQIAIVRRFLAPQREALGSLASAHKNGLDEDTRQLIREQNDRIIRYIEDLDLMKEKAQVMQEELINQIMEQQNARMYLLSIVAVIFLPISFVTGLFGMNVAGLPGVENPLGFLYVAGSMALVTSFIVGMLKWRSWF